MMGTLGAVLSVIWVRSAPCTRCLAYASALRYPVDSVPAALTPIVMRACSMTVQCSFEDLELVREAHTALFESEKTRDEWPAAPPG